MNKVYPLLMGIGLSLSKAPFEDPHLAEGVEGYAWDDLMEHLDTIAAELGYGDYASASGDFRKRAAIQEVATIAEVREMIRRYFEAGNGQVSEMDALQLIQHLAKSRNYFQPTPDEDALNQRNMVGYFENEEVTTPWEFLGDAKSRAIRTAVQDLKADCYVGDIHLSVYADARSSDTPPPLPRKPGGTKAWFSNIIRKRS